MLVRNQIFAYFLVIVILALMLGAFWVHDWKYILPTPIPQNYKTVLPNTHIDFGALAFQKTLNGRVSPKPIFLHFFSPTCPCSAYNIEHFKYLVQTYKHQIDFYAVLFADEENYNPKKFKDVYGIDIPVVTKQGIDIALVCGVYSTPQATLIKDGKLYYRGNYNRNKYCSDKNTNFAEIALRELLAGKPAQMFGKAATMAYGCELPE